MRRHLLKLLSLWILPLLVARALVPAGFMLSAEAGRLQLTFCPSGVVQPLGLAAVAQQQAHAEHHDHDGGMHHAGMHHAGGDEASSSHSAQDDAPCPFSLVASATLLSVPYSAVAAVAADERFEFIATPVVQAGPIRTDRIRGPPSLA
jgi:hypothetical protein